MSTGQLVRLLRPEFSFSDDPVEHAIGIEDAELVRVVPGRVARDGPQVFKPLHFIIELPAQRLPRFCRGRDTICRAVRWRLNAQTESGRCCTRSDERTEPRYRSVRVRREVHCEGRWHWCGNPGTLSTSPAGWHWLCQCGRLPTTVPVPNRSHVTEPLARHRTARTSPKHWQSQWHPTGRKMSARPWERWGGWGRRGAAATGCPGTGDGRAVLPVIAGHSSRGIRSLAGGSLGCGLGHPGRWSVGRIGLVCVEVPHCVRGTRRTRECPDAIFGSCWGGSVLGRGTSGNGRLRVRVGGVCCARPPPPPPRGRGCGRAGAGGTSPFNPDRQVPRCSFLTSPP